jgi:hypothetical protein
MKKFSALLLLSTLCLSISPAAAQFNDEPPMDDPEPLYMNFITFAEELLDTKCECEDLQEFTECTKSVERTINNRLKTLIRFSGENFAEFKREMKSLREDVDANCQEFLVPLPDDE